MSDHEDEEEGDEFGRVRFVDAGGGWLPHEPGDPLPRGPFASMDAGGGVTLWDHDRTDEGGEGR